MKKSITFHLPENLYRRIEEERSFRGRLSGVVPSLSAIVAVLVQERLNDLYKKGSATASIRSKD